MRILHIQLFHYLLCVYHKLSSTINGSIFYVYGKSRTNAYDWKINNSLLWIFKRQNPIKINRYMFSFHDTANYVYINKTLLDSTRLKNIEKCQNVMTWQLISLHLAYYIQLKFIIHVFVITFPICKRDREECPLRLFA